MRYDRERKTVLLPAAELATYARRRGSLEAINFTPALDAPVPDASGIGTAGDTVLSALMEYDSEDNAIALAGLQVRQRFADWFSYYVSFYQTDYRRL